MNFIDIVSLHEAYVAVYDEELRDELESSSIREDLSFIDDLSDNELTKIMEEIFSEGEFELNECVELLDFQILSEETEMERMNRLQNQATRAKKSAAATAKREKSAERERVGRKHAVKRLQVAATRAGRNLASRAKTLGAGAASAAMGGAAEAGRKLSSAKEKVKGFLSNVKKAAIAGYGAAKKEFGGEAGKEARARTTGRQMRRLARRQASAARGRDTSEFERKPSGKPSDPWSGSATKPSSRSSVTTKTTKALSGSSARAALPPAKESDRRAAAKAKLQKASAGSTARGIRFAGERVGQLATQRAHTGIQSALEKFRKKAGISEDVFNDILNIIFEEMIYEGYVDSYENALYVLESLSESDVQDVVESYLVEETEIVDLYDVVLEHLLDEGFAENEEAAAVIMANMSEEWRDEILDEGFKRMDRAKIERQARRLGGDRGDVLRAVAGRMDTEVERKYSTSQARKNRAGAGSEYRKAQELRARDDAKADFKKYGLR